MSALMSLVLRGQAPAEQPSFEVASIRPAAVADPMRGIRVFVNGGPGSKDPGRFTAQNFSLFNLVTMAYEISHWQLSAPDWMKTSMFNIAATVPEGATKEQFHLMLQRLLAERFQLKVHGDAKEMSLYDLVVAKNGPKLKESKGYQETAPLGAPMGPLKRDSEGYPELPPGRRGMLMMGGRARMQMIDESMEHFTSTLMQQVGGPVHDGTGLKGKYDFTLSWSTGQSVSAGAASAAQPGSPLTAPPDYPSGPTIFEALKDQLGLSLEKKKGEVKILVVDHVEKVPTAN